MTVFPDGTHYIDEKVHLKEGNEEKFFRSGTKRKGFHYRDIKFDFVICREFRNIEEAEVFISKDTDVVYWPGCLRRNDSRKSVKDFDDEEIRDFARRNRVNVIAANWANFLDRDGDGNMGGSYVITAFGEIENQCKWDEEDYLIFEYKNS